MYLRNKLKNLQKRSYQSNSMVLEKAIQLRMDLTKACGCIRHDVLIAKIAAYEFDKAALNLIRDCLSNRY